MFKCTFTVINRQPPPGFFEITANRVWVTDVYEGVYFNDFIKSGLAVDIYKRIIMSGMIYSSWRFRRFDRFCITVNSDELIDFSK